MPAILPVRGLAPALLAVLLLGGDAAMQAQPDQVAALKQSLYMERAAALIHKYVPPAAQQIFRTVGFDLGKIAAFDVGYRCFDLNYESGEGPTFFKYDVLTQGPVAGFVFRF